MKVSYKEFLEKLGVMSEMQGYETQPWQVADLDLEATCSAEVRVMDGDCAEIEAEIIFDKQDSKDESDDDSSGEEGTMPNFEIVLWMHAKIGIKEKYSIDQCRFEGQDFKNSVGGWEDKACKFFKACVREMKRSKLPDFEEIKDEVMGDGDGSGGQGGRGGGRKPGIKPNQLINGMKRGGAGF